MDGGSGASVGGQDEARYSQEGKIFTRGRTSFTLWCRYLPRFSAIGDLILIIY